MLVHIDSFRGPYGYLRVKAPRRMKRIACWPIQVNNRHHFEIYEAFPVLTNFVLENTSLIGSETKF